MTVYETKSLHTPFGRAVYFDLSSPLRMHVHSALHTLIHLGGAPATYTFGDGDERVSDGALFTLVDPWTVHTDERRGGLRSQVLALYVEPTMVRIRSGSTGRIGFEDRSATLRENHLADIDRLVGLLRSESGTDDAVQAFADTARSLVSDFGAWSDRGDFPGTGAMDRHVRRALEQLDERRGQPFDGTALVAESELGRSRLFDRFREVVGLTPKGYADALRAEVAIDMLSREARTIAEVATALGFGAPANFTRFMRDYTGLTPSEHRKRARARGEAVIFVDEFK